jgi:hypothetical protein
LVKDNHVPCIPTPPDQTNVVQASPADPLQTLPGWAPPAGCGAQAPGSGAAGVSYRSCEWSAAVGN